MQGEATSELHPLWRKVTALDGRTFYYNPFTGRVSRRRFEAPPPVQGGILSDEACSRSVLHSVLHKHAALHSSFASVAAEADVKPIRCLTLKT